MSDADLLLRRYWPAIQAEYERLGIAAEMERYFTGSGEPITAGRFEAELAMLRAMPSGIGFDAYCAQCGLDGDSIRRTFEETLQSWRS